MLISGPRSENPTFVPACRSPVTAITPGQFAGDPTACPMLLPAAATITAPAALISVMAARYADEHVLSLPRLRLSTRAGFVLRATPGTASPAAQRMAAMMS